MRYAKHVRGRRLLIVSYVNRTSSSQCFFPHLLRGTLILKKHVFGQLHIAEEPAQPAMYESCHMPER